MSGRWGAGRIPEPTCSLGETSQVVTGSSGLPGVWVQLLPDKHGEGCDRMADGLGAGEEWEGITPARGSPA